MNTFLFKTGQLVKVTSKNKDIGYEYSSTYRDRLEFIQKKEGTVVKIISCNVFNRRIFYVTEVVQESPVFTISFWEYELEPLYKNIEPDKQYAKLFI